MNRMLASIVAALTALFVVALTAGAVHAATASRALSTTRIWTVAPDGAVCIEFDLADGERVEVWTDPRYGAARLVNDRALIYTPRIAATESFLVRTPNWHDNVRVSVSPSYARSAARQAAEVAGCGAAGGADHDPRVAALEAKIAAAKKALD